MKETRLLMGMPVSVEIVDASATSKELAAVLDYFIGIDRTFSTYKPESEISRINRGELPESDWSDDMRVIFMLAEETKQRSLGFFDIRKPDGSYDPSGIVKGWAIYQASKLLERRGPGKRGFRDFYVDAGGDIQTSGHNADGESWRVGIKNPFNQNEIVKTVLMKTPSCGIATSGTYIRGEHIYNPKTGLPANEIVSLTVIGQNVYEADRFATAAFAMGKESIRFIEAIPGLEGFMIVPDGAAVKTSGFDRYVLP